jgi:hypothetical protein
MLDCRSPIFTSTLWDRYRLKGGERDMYPETPYVARVVAELEQRGLVKQGGSRAGDDPLHAVFFLLRETCGFSVPFTFKGALMPFSEGLANVYEDIGKSRELLAPLEAEVELRQEDREAIDRLATLSEPAEGFTGDKHRWQALLAAYLFLAGSPMYMDGFRSRRDSDFQHFYGQLFDQREIGQATAYLERENLVSVT